jgi:hypothetical protein
MNFTKGFCFEKKSQKSQDFEEKNLEFPKILMMGQSNDFFCFKRTKPGLRSLKLEAPPLLWYHSKALNARR